MTRPLGLLACLVFLASPATAGEFAPGGNASPLTRPFALPSLGETAITPPGRPDVRITFDAANEYATEGSCASECILLDGETRRMRIDYRGALGNGWDYSLHVPMLDRGGGFLDSWIQDWHGWFGLPNGGREFATEDQYRYRYVRDGVTLLDEIEEVNGLGDVALGLGTALGQDSALRAMLKFPTGDGAALSGDNLGGAVWVDLGLPLPRTWSGYLSAGYSRNERGEVLTAMQNEEVFFGGLGLLVPVTADTRLSLQGNAHTQLYDGATVTPLARKGAPVTIGLQWQTGADSVFDIGIQEDASVNGSPDFAVYVSYGTAKHK